MVSDGKEVGKSLLIGSGKEEHTLLMGRRTSHY